MSPQDIGTIAGVAIAAVGVMGTIMAWFYKRGKNEQALLSSVDKNTEATNQLASQVGALTTTLERHEMQLTEHHFRLKALEGIK